MRKILVLVATACLATSVWAQNGDLELFREAERRFESGDYELALDRYQTLIQEHPVSQYVPDAQFRVAVSLYRTGAPGAALDQLDRVERRYRSTRYLEYVPFWRGVINYDTGNYAEAVASLREFQSSALRDPEARSESHFYIGLAELGRGDEQAAIAALERMIELAPQSESEGYAVTLLLSLYAKNAMAQELLALTSRLDPALMDGQWRPHVVLYEAEAYYAQENLDEAIPRYRDSEDAPPELATLAYQRLFQLAQNERISEDPSDVLRRAEQALAGRTDVLKEFWLRVGIDAYNQERYDLAELYFRRIWDFRGSEFIPATVPLYLSRLLDRRGDVSAAEEVLSAYLDIYGDESEERLRVQIALGNLRLRLGRNSEAVATLAAAYEEYEQGDYFAEAAYQYAFALRRTGREEEALQVIDSAFTAGRTGGIQPNLLRLRSRVLRDLGREADALQALFEYLPLRPADAQAALEYVNLLFGLERYTRVVDEVPEIVSELRSQESLTDGIEARLRYVHGLALINTASYGEASQAFRRVLDLTSSDTEVGRSLRPYALYYRGWGSYRNGDYRDAVRSFTTLLDDHADHPQAARAAYLSGWSSFRLRDYDEAAEALARVGQYTTSEQLSIEASFLLGRVLAAQRSFQQAASTFRSLYLDDPDSEYADDAWFEYAEAQVGLGNGDAAAAAYAELLDVYPASPLAEAASFRRAEVFYEEGRYAEAQDAFFAYRTTFPEGDRMDAALYWGGIASDELGESAGALLLWERLIGEYRESPFRADAMQRAAAAHAERDEYRQALNFYTELQAAYPDTARSIGAQRRIDELVLLINGLGEREAELIVTIENAGGAESDDGRQAIIELARMTIYEDTATTTEAASVIPLLEEVTEQRTRDPAAASQALFLRAEYRYRQQELRQAADLYLQAAAVGAADRDLAALSIYRAAVMYSTLGRSSEVEALIERLEEDFPNSEWLEEARTLERGGSND
ncbi:MAG: tetratricopeptide repeat protein [Spirochaetota bacterium]